MSEPRRVRNVRLMGERAARLQDREEFARILREQERSGGSTGFINEYVDGFASKMDACMSPWSAVFRQIAKVPTLEQIGYSAEDAHRLRRLMADEVEETAA